MVSLYNVRLYNTAGKAEYVTVDTELPKGGQVDRGSSMNHRNVGGKRNEVARPNEVFSPHFAFLRQTVY